MSNMFELQSDSDMNKKVFAPKQIFFFEEEAYLKGQAPIKNLPKIER